jgi:photosynthetic reaction center H subunit
MGTGAITSYFDVAQLVLYMFWIFFFGLIYYLIRENHREGYPLDNDRGLDIQGWPRAPEPKTYLLADGREIAVPRGEAPEVITNAEPTFRGAGSPIEPTGDVFLAGVGPGAWSRVRPDEADLDHHGLPKIRPLSLCEGFGVSERDPDPRGKPLFDAAGDVAGTVRELWIDCGEMSFRYLEAEVGARRVLVPITFARIDERGTHVHALYAEQFADVPAPKASDRVTLLEEERITAYYGAGMLYADADRTEPLV